jgi:CHAD domain-containing protein
MDSNGLSAAESVYVVRDGVPPEAITSSLQALVPSRHRSIGRHRFTLLDTFDRRVARAGARLTSSGVNGAVTWSWQPRGEGNRLEVRANHPMNFAWDLPNGPLQQLLASVVGVRRLISQAEAEGYGSLLDVLDDRTKTVARVRIESGRARLPLSGEDWHPLPTTITVTRLRGFQDEYERLVPLIESRPGVEPCPVGVEGVLLRAIGAPEPCDASLCRLDVVPSVHAEAGVRQIHLALLGIIVANEPGLRANLDAEFLHDFRVAVRRTRSLLGQVRQVFPAPTVEHFSTEFSWLGRLTGPPRDMDVLVLALRQHPADLPVVDLAALTASLGDVQQQEHHRLIEALDSERYRRLISDWEAFLQQPTTSETAPSNAARPLVQVVARRAWVLSRRIMRIAANVDGDTGPRRLHELRIIAKKLRYLIDVTPSFYEVADRERILCGLKTLQRVLGDFNDAEIQANRLLECGRALGDIGGSAGALLAFGRLAERSCHRGERLREQVADELARFCARDMRAACRRAFKRLGEAEKVR